MTALRGGADLPTVEAFLNTLDVSGSLDRIAEPDALRTWLTAQGLLPADDTAAGADDVVTAHELRRVLRDLAAANHDGTADPVATAALNDLTATVGLTARFIPDGTLELTGTAPGVTGALARLLGAVAVAVADGTWPRLKLCRNDACAVAFYDRSRNRSGRWCDMAVCGNRMKARTFRERHR